MPLVPQPTEGWTAPLLKAHFDEVIVRLETHFDDVIDLLKISLEESRSNDDKRYEQRFLAQEKAVQAALAAAALAVDKAEVNSEKWRDNANEWRDAMNDREANFLSQDVATTRFGTIDHQIADLKKSRDLGTGRLGGLNSGWGYLVGLVGLIGAIIALVTRT